MVNFYSCYVMDCNERTATVEDVAGKLIIVYCHTPTTYMPSHGVEN